jgi:serine/threonine-protein kinase RsbW
MVPAGRFAEGPAGTRLERRNQMASLPNVRLDLSNRPENVLLVRETLTGLAEAVGLNGGELSDVRTAATEACNNVVLHAYAGEKGPMEIEIEVGEGCLRLVVRDRGVGMREDALSSANGENGIGLPVIAALTHRVDFGATLGGGSEVRMEFETPSVRELAPAPGEGFELAPFSEIDTAGTATVSVAPAPLARAIVPRLLAVLAARAHFSTDRISDTQLLADAIVAHAAEAVSGSHLGLKVTVELRALEVSVGPLISESAGGLVRRADLDALGPLLEKLADRHELVSAGPHEMLKVHLLDQRQG